MRQYHAFHLNLASTFEMIDDKLPYSARDLDSAL